MMELLEALKQEKKTYADMVELCTDGRFVIANEYAEKLKRKINFKKCIFSGKCEIFYYKGEEIGKKAAEKMREKGEKVDYELKEIFSYFIIDEEAAKKFKVLTNEIVFYIKKHGVYLLGVSHFDTRWENVPANWKDEN